MGFNSGFKGLINVLYVNKQEFSASSWRSNQGYIKVVFDSTCVPKVFAFLQTAHFQFSGPASA